MEPCNKSTPMGNRLSIGVLFDDDFLNGGKIIIKKKKNNIDNLQK